MRLLYFSPADDNNIKPSDELILQRIRASRHHGALLALDSTLLHSFTMADG
jgi:hypothetical protein